MTTDGMTGVPKANLRVTFESVGQHPSKTDGLDLLQIYTVIYVQI